MLVVLTVMMIVYSFSRKFSLTELGFNTKYLKGSLILNGIYSAITVMGLLLFYKFNLIRKPVPPDYNWFFIYYVFVSCPCQEFLYRSLVYAELKQRNISDNYFILISAVNYAFLHAFYHDWITIAAAFVSGIIWGFIYKKYPNFFGVALSHALLGVISLLIGLV